MIPIKPIASPLNAPSMAPIWMAAAVPTPWEEAPNASPLAIWLSIPSTLITIGPTILPKIPTATTMTAVSEGMPPAFSATPHSDRGGDGFRLERGDQRLVGSHQFTDDDYAYDSDNGPDKYGSQDRNDISL